MRTTVNLDDSLLDRAEKSSGLKERSALLRAALEALIQRESAHVDIPEATAASARRSVITCRHPSLDARQKALCDRCRAEPCIL